MVGKAVKSLLPGKSTDGVVIVVGTGRVPDTLLHIGCTHSIKFNPFDDLFFSSRKVMNIGLVTNFR